MYTLTPSHTSATTGESGNASISIKIPGTFFGQNPTTDGGKLFQKFNVWCDTPTPGDLIKNIRIEDLDGILSAIPNNIGGYLSDAFPLYPIIMPFYDVDNSNQGLLIPPSGLELNVTNNDGNRTLKFCPAELYLTATFTSGDESADKTLRVNVYWGTVS